MIKRGRDANTIVEVIAKISKEFMPFSCSITPLSTYQGINLEALSERLNLESIFAITSSRSLNSVTC